MLPSAYPSKEKLLRANEVVVLTTAGDSEMPPALRQGSAHCPGGKKGKAIATGQLH